MIAQLAELVPIDQPTPYLLDKVVRAHAGVMTDREGLKTYVPAFDVDGTQWTTQYIPADGTKRFAKDSRKEGCFQPVGGMEALARAPALVIAEGYTTAAQVAEALGHATVAAFDSGNLESVARALKAKYPDKPVSTAGDDDRHLAFTHGHNPVREKAEAAARAVAGPAVFPIFPWGENDYPADLPRVTPELHAAHLRATRRLADMAAGAAIVADDERASLERSLLTSAQLNALHRMKQHTDFNDLARRGEAGCGAVKRQVGSIAQRSTAQGRSRDRKRYPGLRGQ